MMGYLSRYVSLPMEEVADEMFAILSERDAIVRKKQMESSQAVINDVYNFGLEPKDGEET